MKNFYKTFILVFLFVFLFSPSISIAAKIQLNSTDSYYKALKYIYYTCGDYFDKSGLDPNDEISRAEFLQIVFCNSKKNDEIEGEEFSSIFDDIKGDEEFIHELELFLFWVDIEIY
jgi:hypothetical protein